MDNSFEPDFDPNSSPTRKRRRISLSSRPAEYSSFALQTSQRRRRVKENDRFIAEQFLSPMLPMNTSPRTRRFSHQIGTSGEGVLRFSTSSSSPSKQVILTPDTPRRRKTVAIMRHCSSALLVPKERGNTASAKFNFDNAPFRVLDAPGLCNDFYSHPIDWSSDDWIACATRKALVLGCMNKVEVHSLPVPLYPCLVALKYNPAKCHQIAAGFDDGLIQLWDVKQRKISHLLQGEGYVGGMSWRPVNGGDLLTVGHLDGTLADYDLRRGTTPVKSRKAHSRRVCSVVWNPDGCTLATGSGDDGVKIWDVRADKKTILDENVHATIQELSEDFSASLELKEKWKIRNNDSTSKAMAWCPWQSHLLAVGGGTRDGAIRLYSTRSRKLLSSVETLSQVSSLHWSEKTTEIVSTHGFAWNAVTLTSAPIQHSIMVHSVSPSTYTLAEVCQAPEPKKVRINGSAMSPDRTKLITAVADETVRVWKVFGQKVGQQSRRALTDRLNLR